MQSRSTFRGVAYVTGMAGAGFPVTASGAQQSYGGGTSDAFVSKISPDGSTLDYSTYLGGNGTEGGNAIAVPLGCASDCDAFVTGYTASTNFPATAGAFQTANGCTSGGTPCTDTYDAFVARINSSGSLYKYVTYLGGHGGDGGFAIAADSLGDAYVGGITDAILTPKFPQNFPIVPATAIQNNFGQAAAMAFISVLNPTGTGPLLYSTYLGGSGFQAINGLALGPDNSIYASGYTYSSDFPTTAGAYQTGFGGFDDMFAVHLVPAPNPSHPGVLYYTVAYSTYLGGSGDDNGGAIAIDSSCGPSGCNAYLAGTTNYIDFPAVNSLPLPAANGELLVSTDSGASFGFTGDLAGNLGGAACISSRSCIGSLNALVVDPSSVPHNVFAGSARNGLYLSTDDGRSFGPTVLSAQQYAVGFNSVALDFSTGTSVCAGSDERVFVGNAQGLYRSTDRGVSFAPTALDDFSVSPVFVDPDTSSLYAGTKSGLLKSTDCGNSFTWTGLPLGTFAFSMAADPNNDPEAIYAGTNRGVFVSSDGGASFSQTGENFQPAFSVAVDSSVLPSHLYAGTQVGLVESTDGFQTTTGPVNTVSLALYDLQIDATAHPSHIYAAGRLNDLGFVLQSTDGGVTFREIGPAAAYLPPVTRLDLDPGSPVGILISPFLEYNAAVAKLSPDGSTLIFSTPFGGTNDDFAGGVATHTTANGTNLIYVAGGTASSDFPIVPGSAQITLSLPAQHFRAPDWHQTNPDAYTDSHSDEHADPDALAHSNSGAFTDADSYSHEQTDPDTLAHSNSDAFTDPDSYSDEHTDADTLAHCDSDTYTDADSYSHEHTDPDTLTHSNSDTRTDSNADSDEHADADTLAHCDSDPFTDADFYSDEHADPDTLAHSNSDAFTDPDSYSDEHTDADALAHSHFNTYTDADSYSHEHADPNTLAHSHSDAYTDPDTLAHSNSDAFTDPDSYSDEHTDPDTLAQCNSNTYADGDADSNSNSDAFTDADSYSDEHADADSLAHSHFNAYTDADSYSDEHADPNTLAHSHSDAFTDPDSYSDEHADPDTLAHSNSDAFTDPDSYSDEHTDADALAHSQFNTYTDADSYSDEHADPDTPAHSNSDAFTDADRDGDGYRYPDRAHADSYAWDR